MGRYCVKTITLWIITLEADGLVLMPVRSHRQPSAAVVEFGQRVRHQREHLGISQEALADRCGLHWTFVGQVERGKRSIRLDNILKLADGLGIEPGDLVNRLPIAGEG